MRFRLIRLRFRRHWRQSQRQVEDLGSQAEQHLEENLVQRLEHLVPVRRFMIGWLALVCLLIGAVVLQNVELSGYYQTLQTIPGGIYNEGLQGRFTTANPLFATTDADLTVSRLIFASLFQINGQGKLIGDLASDYSVDSRGTTYTIHLKPHLTWQDGRPLTSADVVFTYQTVQNPDAQSPLQNSWQGVTVTAPDSHTVVFKLPDVLASFPYSLTTGIIPQHLLANIPPTELRSADFNTVHPVGAGPFAWGGIQVSGDGNPDTNQEQIALTPFAGYNGGQPKLQEFVVQAFADQAQLITAFQSGRLTAVEGLAQVPSQLEHKNSVVQHSLILRAATMVFFKTSSGVLADQAVRQALITGSNVPQIIAKLGYPTRAVREPLLEGQLGYDPTLTQAGFNPVAAAQQLTSDGWVMGRDGLRTKTGQLLTFSLSVADEPDYHEVASQLQQQWQSLGVKLNVQYLDVTDFQNVLSNHSYDAILDGISIGVDPDVFIYWDSSQADIRSPERLNLSEWSNTTADAALEAGRTRLDPALRVIKYKPFLQAWQQAAPALGLYQPRLLYLTNGPVSGLTDQPITTVTDRLVNVQNWEIQQSKVTN
jgi:peptide/nickel transport system substrate-binding protein